MNPSRNSQIGAVLFDLDGTLADTAPDLAWALNTLLTERGQDPLPESSIRPVVSDGTTALLKLGFGIDGDHADFPEIRDLFLALYQDNIATHTQLFPGMDRVLNTLEAMGMDWGVVTNKPAFLTDPLMAQLGLTERAGCIVSGDTTAERKPHPQPLFHACHCLGGRTEACIYVGDAERDIQAGHRAGMKTLVALFGYIAETADPLSWSAHGMVKTPEEILDWVEHFNRID